jgi:hypothetical protein
MRTFGAILIVLGFVVGLGPIAVLLFMSMFPSGFDENTILAWHYLSAFGLILYGPTGYVLYRLGRWLRAK